MQNSSGKKAVKIFGCGGCGCASLVVGFVGLIIYFTAFSNFCARMMGEETYPLSGDPARFEPFASVSDIRSKIGVGARLKSIEARYVRSDGTMDLNARYKPAPNVTYEFVMPLDKEPENAPPIGAGRSPGDVWLQTVTVKVYEPGQRRHVQRISGASRSSYSYTNEGMDVDRGTPSMGSIKESLDEPKISAKEMWEIALKKGADKDAVATLSYEEDGYRFTIAGSRVFLEWDRDGKFNEDRSHFPGQER